MPTQAPGELAPELVEILRQAEMRGERTVNWFRIGFYVLSALMLVGSYGVNTAPANLGFTIQVGVALAYGVGLATWFRLKPGVYAPWLKYVSITVDLAVLHYSAVIMGSNHQGIIEYYQSFVPLVLVFWNVMSALRYSVAACLYSGVLSLVLSASVLAMTVSMGLLPVSEISTFGTQAINIADESTRVVFIALPAFAAAFIARASRNLIVRAEKESLNRAKLEQQKERLSKYLSKDLAELVVQDPSLFELGGTRRHATILFSDIRNFTPLAESVQPEEVVHLLNEYFTKMVSVVFQYGGTLDKFLGDGLMAEFGVPFDLPRHELRAVVVALEMVAEVEQFNAQHDLEGRGLSPLAIGVGVATGPVVAGNIGSPERMEYTAIGDTVNFAARLEALNKSLATSIIVSQATRLAIGDKVPFKPLPPIKVKGKTGEPPLFAVDRSRITPELLLALKDEVQGTAAPETASRTATLVH